MTGQDKKAGEASDLMVIAVPIGCVVMVNGVGFHVVEVDDMENAMRLVPVLPHVQLVAFELPEKDESRIVQPEPPKIVLPGVGRA